jgi:DNA-binding NarL/FixJ family response regulator
MTIAVLISDPDPSSARRLARELEAHADDLEVVAVCGPAAASGAAAACLPDVALLGDGAHEAHVMVRGVRTSSPATRVLVLTADPLDGRHFAAVRAGATGAVARSAGVAAQAGSIRDAAADRLPLDAAHAASARVELGRSGGAPMAGDVERAILDHLERGADVGDVSRALEIPVERVWRRLRDVRAKLELADRLDSAGATPVRPSHSAPADVSHGGAHDPTGETRSRGRRVAGGTHRTDAAG